MCYLVTVRLGYSAGYLVYRFEYIKNIYDIKKDFVEHLSFINIFDSNNIESPSQPECVLLGNCKIGVSCRLCSVLCYIGSYSVYKSVVWNLLLPWNVLGAQV